MTKIVDEKIAEYYACKPTEFRALKSLTLSQAIDAGGCMEQRISLVLARDFEKQGECLYLNFYKVRGCEFRQPETSHIVLSHVEILPGHSLPQIESEYLVRDPEQERILWFECGDFEAWVQ